MSQKKRYIRNLKVRREREGIEEGGGKEGRGGRREGRKVEGDKVGRG